jgi:WD40 repeat protein/tRNA A-37 threonylcarbamoyl transferase component Bud32
MPVRVRCPNAQCQQIAEVPESVIGKSAKCRACGIKFVLQPYEETADGAAEVSLSMLKDEPAPNLPALTRPGAQELPALTRPGSPRPAPDPEAAPGTVIGRFEVRERLGSGAFGTVYLAFDPQLQREVALKVPRRNVIDNPRRVERFLREARAAAKLRHPNIVPVYDAGQSGELFYIASAYVRGEPLSDVVEEGPVDFKRAATIVRGLAEGLAYAHQEGIVHRDVKPANVMLESQSQPLLMDFGLAAQVDAEDFRLPEDEAEDRAASHDDSRLTRAGTVMGTPAYMAPEVARGQHGEAQPASDQYALGVVLYELLTGRTPFEGPLAAVLHRVVNESPPKPSEFRKDLPTDLEAVCLKAMSRRPGDRYVTCAAMADDLRRWLDGEPVKARRVGFVGRAKRLMKQERGLAFTGFTAVAAAVLVVLGLVWQLSSIAAERNHATSDARRIENEKREAEARHEAEREAAEKARLRQKADSDSALAHERLQAGDPNGAADLLNGIPAEARNPAWPFLIAQAEGFPEYRRVWMAMPTVALDFDTASRHILQVTSDGDLIVWDVWTAREVRRLSLRLPKMPNYWHSAALSADGRRIATYSSMQNQPGFGGPFGGPVPIMDMPKGDGKAEPPNPQIIVWDEQGKVVRTFPVSNDPYRLALSPDGALLAAAGGPLNGPQTLTVLDVNSGAAIGPMAKTLAAVPGPAFAMAFSPDGKRLAATTILAGGEIRVWDTATGAEQLMINDRTAVITHLAFSPDGTRLAAAGGGDRLEGPELTQKVFKPVAEKHKRTVERNGKQVEEDYETTRMVEEEVRYRGYRYPRTKLVMKPVCMKETHAKTIYKTVMTTEGYTEYVTRTRKVKGPDGKEETVTEKFPVTKQRQVCQMIPAMQTYEVSMTKMVAVSEMDIEPLVRIWAVDDGKLQTTITESAPVTALAWRPDSAVLATASNRRDACSGTGDGCSGYGGFHGGHGIHAMPAPATIEPKVSSRDLAQWLAVMVTTFGHGGFGPEAQADQAEVSLWDPVTGKRLHVLTTPTAPVTSLALSADGNHIAAGSMSGSLTLWSTSSRWLLANGRGDGPVTELLFSQDSTRLAGFSKCNNTVRLWDGQARSLITRLEGAGPFMQFLPSGRFLATGPGTGGFGFYGHGYGDPSVSPLDRWVSETGNPEKHPGDRDGVLVYNPDGNRFVVNDQKSMMGLAVHDGQSGAQVCRLEQSADNMELLKIQISLDGSRVAAVTRRQQWNEPKDKDEGDGPIGFTIRDDALLWDGVTGKLLARKTDVAAADLSADGKRWAVATRPTFAPPPIMPAPPPGDDPPAPRKVESKEPALPPTERKKPSAVDEEQIQKKEPEPKSKDEPPQKGPGPIPAKQIQPKPPTLTIYDGDGKEVQKLPGAEFSYSSLTFDPTGKAIVAVTGDDVVKVWNVSTGKLTAQYRTNDNRVAISPDGRFLAIHRPQPIHQMIAPKMEKPKKIPAPDGAADLDPIAQKVEPVPATPAPDAAVLEPPFGDVPQETSQREMWIAVSDLATGQLVWNASVVGTGHGGVAFSADGKRLALGYVQEKRGYVVVWDTAVPQVMQPVAADEFQPIHWQVGNTFKYEIVARYSGHFGAVNAVAFSPDGTKLASGGDDRVVKVWKLPAAGEVGPGADDPRLAAPKFARAD